MDKRSSELNFHQRMELLVRDMVEKDIGLKDALREFEKATRPRWPRPWASTGILSITGPRSSRSRRDISSQYTRLLIFMAPGT
jgi:hypothetical protein